MIHERRPTSRLQRGAVAVAAVVMMILVNLIIIGMVLVGARHQDLSVHTIETVRAFYGAEAATNLALRELAAGEDFDGSGEIGSIEPIAPEPMRGVTIGVDVETAGDTHTLHAWGQTSRVWRRNRLTITQPVGGGGVGYPGLLAYYHVVGEPLWAIEHVDWDATPDAMAVTPNLNWPGTGNSDNPFWAGGPNNYYGARFIGWINVPEAGTWTFETTSDDGSMLYIDGEEIVDNDGRHSMRSRSGTVELDEGWHPLEVLYFENQGRHGLIVQWEGPGVPQREVIPPEAFAHTPNQLLQPLPRIAARETIKLWGEGSGSHCFIDAYDSSNGTYNSNETVPVVVSTNSVQYAAVEMSRSTIYGNLRIGVGGDPNAVAQIYQHATITGSVTANEIPLTTPQIIVPDVFPSSAGYRAYWSGTHNYSSNFRYSSWTIGNNSVINITEPIVGRIDGNFNVQGSARINLEPGATLTLYVYGNVNLYQTAAINLNTEDPDRVRIYMVGASPQMTMTDRTTVYGSVINPDGAIAMWGNGPMPHNRLFGTYFGRTIEIGSRTRIHAQQATVPIDDDGGGELIVHTWREASPAP